jgi:L-lactate utilization protein LutC
MCCELAARSRTSAPFPIDEIRLYGVIAGPSRTAEIEQIPVRKVHGPSLVSVVVV